MPLLRSLTSSTITEEPPKSTPNTLEPSETASRNSPQSQPRISDDSHPTQSKRSNSAKNTRKCAKSENIRSWLSRIPRMPTKNIRSLIPSVRLSLLRSSSSRVKKSSQPEPNLESNARTAKWVEENVVRSSSTRIKILSRPEPILESSVASAIFEEEDTWNLQLIGTKTPKALEIQKLIPKFEVDVVYAVRNAKIEERYMDEVAKTLENGTFRGFHSVWHGTNADDAIARSGFEVGGVDVRRRHGAALGMGVYATTRPSLAAKYARRCSKDATTLKLILCELCETDETVSKEEKMKVFVSPNKRLIRPMYVVHVFAESKDCTGNRNT